MEKEKRIRTLTHLYYSNPKIQEAILKFSKNREVVPRYFESFGKRPDMIQYLSDINGLVKKGATSFHASEELWINPLELSSEISAKKMDKLRKGWDLLIDIDSPFIDCSKIAAKLLIEALEYHGIKNYGIKFSGSKGFHIIVGWKAFPEEFQGIETKKMFPEWARAISEYLMNYIRKDYNKYVGEILKVEDIVKRTKLSKEELQEVHCASCGRTAKKGTILKYKCPVCGMSVERRNQKQSKRKLKCLDNNCAGILEFLGEEEYYYCEYCKDFDNKNLNLNSIKNPEKFEKVQGVSAEKIANLDLVLVAPRHLFRMPYSLHEKTALASVVLKKNELDDFEIKQANPMKVKIEEFYPENEAGEGRRLLSEALDWKKNMSAKNEKFGKERYKDFKFEEVKLEGITEEMFPKPIKKLLRGLEDGKKRGLFILLTFLKNCGFSPEEINDKVRKWNEKNSPPLKEGYIRSQVDWHLKQRKKILPPNYDNESFYKDLGLLDEKPNVKNPLVEVMRKVRKRNFKNEIGITPP